MNNQVSIAGQKGNLIHFELSGESLSCADQRPLGHHLHHVGAAPFDQQAIDQMATVVDLSADTTSPVDVQSEPDNLDKDDVDHPSTREGQKVRANHRIVADSHPQDPAGHIFRDDQQSAVGGIDSSAVGGHFATGVQNPRATYCTHLDDDGQIRCDTQHLGAEVVTPHYRDPSLIAHIRALYKQRNDIIRAHGNLTRQAISICRHAAGYNTFLPEKERGAAMKRGDRMLADLKAGEEGAVALVGMSAGYLLNVIEQAEFDKQKRRIERLMEKSAIGMGADLFIADTKGFSYTMLANIIGEAGDLANYGTVSRLWKRMGLAVIDGKRQSKQSDVATAMAHGYNPARRSAMWNIGESILKQHLRNVKDEEGNRTDQSIAIGHYGEVYLDHKKRLAVERQDMTKAHIHNRAKRYMEKRLLRDLWLAWNRA